ncbi:hypothetical protein [Paenibacillus sp. BT-177]|uniref:hypothetical protein n=1 Tax=Paenibacillus sp. BT-177 TaxID=2986930 RepID=UPI0021F7CCE8|nr:hypothetical protein [Paenibacillus sp. BT-177]
MQTELKAFSVEYGAKRPLTFRPPNIDTLEKQFLFDGMDEYVSKRVTKKQLESLSDESVYRLVEKFAIEVCKAESPTKNYGIKKAEVRYAILYRLQEIMKSE